jgi:sugar-specific transcriptional regulator TrmB
MEIIFNLMRLGLNEKQAKIYLAGVKSGPTTATVLAQNSEVKRGTIYGILKELKLLGLCIESKSKKKKLFIMSDPNQLKVIQNDRDNVLTSLLPILRNYSTNKNIPKIFIYQGLDEVREIYIDSLKQKGEILTIESTDGIVKDFGMDWALSYINKRKKLKIPVRMLATETTESKFFKLRDGNDLRETKILPKKFGLGIDIEIYSNKVLN